MYLFNPNNKTQQIHSILADSNLISEEKNHNLKHTQTASNKNGPSIAQYFSSKFLANSVNTKVANSKGYGDRKLQPDIFSLYPMGKTTADTQY